MFSASTYINRRANLRNLVGSGIVIIPGNEEASMNFLDNWYSFRQDGTFNYYCGLQTPGQCLVIDADNGEEVLYGTELTMDHIIWEGPQPQLAEKAATSGIKKVEERSTLNDQVRKWRRENRTIHILPPYRPEHILMYQQWFDTTDFKSHVSESLVRAIISQRNIKTEEEIKEMHLASTISGKMHLAAMKSAKAGMKEYELRGLLQGIAQQGGGDISFPIILTVNGHILHNHVYHNELKNGQLLLVDCGAETAMGYAGDRTSTMPVAGKFTSMQNDIYQTVLDSYNTAVHLLKPGISYKEVHIKAVESIANSLIDLKILKGNPSDVVEQGIHALFMPHGLGHMLGIDVHDMENLGEDLVGYNDHIKRSTQFGLKSLRLGRELEQGFVLTVEPGVYFIPELIKKWKSEGKFKDSINYSLLEKEYLTFGGIRIEDDYHITSKGYELLGEPLPRGIKEIEAIRERAIGE